MTPLLLRQPIRGVRTPLRAFGQTTTTTTAQPAAWDGPWRRLFTLQARGAQSSTQVWRQRPAPFQSLLARLRCGPAHPSYATTTTTTATNNVFLWGGAARRWFRFSTRRGGAQGAGAKSQEPQSLSARLKKLSKEYGWAALGVYLGLSVLDFPFCFLLVRIVGTETIGKFEHYVVSAVKQLIPDSLEQWWHENWRSVKKAEVEGRGDDEISDKVEMVGWGIEEAQERNKAEASLGTQLALAYAIHKSFIFLRVPLTAAVTPKVVKVLRSWGWNIGKRGGR